MALKNALGDIALDQTLQELRNSTQEMTRLLSASTKLISCMRVDGTGRLAIAIETSANTQAISGSVTASGTVTANIGTFGLYAVNSVGVAVPQLAADSLRKNIVVS